MTDDEARALIRLAEYDRKRHRRQVLRRRLRKAGLIALVPIAGPLVGSIWDEQDRRGWR